jgi:hypothetical protein
MLYLPNWSNTQIKFVYNGTQWALLNGMMLSVGKWDQIYLDLKVLDYSFILNSCSSLFAFYYQSVIVIIFMSQSDIIKQFPL